MIGRDEEFGFVRARLRDGPGVFLTGAPGTGKSRLGHEVVSELVRSDEIADSILCTQATAEIPFLALSKFAGDSELGTRAEHILKGWRDGDPLVLFVDDVNQLDRMSWAVIHQAVNEGHVRLIATARSEATPTPESVALWKDLGLARVELQPLSRPETAAMLASGLGAEIDRGAVRHIWDASRGVPLYVKELGHAAVLQGALVKERGVWMAQSPIPTPSSLIDLIRSRLDGLSATEARAAEVIGAAEVLPIAVLESLSGASAVVGLERANIVVTTDTTCRLAHPLFGEVIRQLTPTARSREILTALVATFDTQTVTDPERLIRLATWQLAANEPNSASLMSGAARAAYDAGDFDLAIRLAEAAHDQGDVEGSLLLGQLHHERGNHDEADLINASVVPTDSQLAHRAVVQRAVNLFFGLGRGDDALAVLAEGPDGLPFNRAWLLFIMGRIDHAQAMIPATGDLAARNVTGAWVGAMAGGPTLALSLLDELEAAGYQPSPSPSRFRDFPNLPRMLSLLELGHLSQAEALGLEGLELSIDQHPSFIRAWWLLFLGLMYQDMGRTRTAVSYFQQGNALQSSLNQPGLRRFPLGGLAYTLAQTADANQGRTNLNAYQHITGRAERAFEHLGRAAEAWHLSGTNQRIASLISAGDDHHDVGALTAARRLWFDAARLGGASEVGDRLTGGQSDWDAARSDFVQAARSKNGQQTSDVAEFFADRRAWLFAAEAWTSASIFLTRAGNRRLAAAAARQADEARGQCEDVDTPGLVAERDTIPLTDREREVVTLAARGSASKQIADDLFISVRTVNNLIQRAYRKLGVTSRQGAAVALGLEVDGG